MRIPKCKGARDLMPHDMRKFRRVKDVFRSSCASWGYEEIRTPTLEYLHLFTAAGTLSSSMLSRVYSFLDWDGWSGERVVLRPDGTIPSARLYVESLSHRPIARLCYVENMFSFEGTGQEARERWQCGVELIGSTEPGGDAELIMLALEVLHKLDIAPVSLKLSHVGLFKTLLHKVGIEDEEQARRLKEILTGDFDVLKNIKDQPTDVKTFLKLLLELQGKSRGFLDNLTSILPDRLSDAKPCIDDMARIAELLDSIGQEYEIDFASGEGFEYYTGMVFQFSSAGKMLGHGGRYDELIPLIGGEQVPASGFALFIDNIMPMLSDDGPPAFGRVCLTSESMQLKGVKQAFEVADQLRQQGYVVEMGLGTVARDDCDCRWVVSLQDNRETMRLSLIDTQSGKEHGGLALDQLLLIIEEAQCQ